MDSTERSAILIGLAKQIAVCLNTFVPLRPWTYVESTEPKPLTVYLRNAGKGRIYLDLTSSKGYDLYDRLAISGWFNIGKNNQYVQVCERGVRVGVPNITVARTRGCEAIAKEISKRFLPEYLRLLELADNQVQEGIRHDDALTAKLNRIAAVAKAKVYPSNSSQVQDKVSVKIGQVYGQIQVFEDNVNLHLSNLTTRQAETIIRYLNKWA